jgi:hypothetical protein
MESKGDKTATGVPRWACLWTTGSTGTHKNSAPNYERELLSLSGSDRRARVQTLPKNSQRRIQRIGFAATGFAATLWLMAVVWIWQVIV